VYVHPTQVYPPYPVYVHPTQVHVYPTQVYVYPTQVYVEPYPGVCSPTQVYVHPTQVVPLVTLVRRGRGELQREQAMLALNHLARLSEDPLELKEELAEVLEAPAEEAVVRGVLDAGDEAVRRIRQLHLRGEEGAEEEVEAVDLLRGLAAQSTAAVRLLTGRGVVDGGR
jgi:hypothetical protein